MNLKVAGVSCVLLAMAGTAQAQLQLAYDDGTAEFAAGRTSTGGYSWMNNFDTPGGSTVLQSVEATFSSISFAGSGLAAGDDFFVFIFGDNDSDPTNGMTGLGSFAATVDAAALDSNQFQSVDVGDLPVTTTNFWVVIQTFISGDSAPAPIDDSQFPVGRSWFLLGNAATPDIVNAREIDALNINGVFMLRATVIPTPASAALLGFAGLAAARRRR